MIEGDEQSASVAMMVMTKRRTCRVCRDECRRANTCEAYFHKGYT